MARSNRQPHWPEELCQRDGYYRYDGGELKRDTLDLCLSRVVRNDGPAMLFDFHFGNVVDLTRPEMAGVVASVWSGAEYPQRAFDDASIWRELFRVNGYSHDGHTAELPTEPVKLFRGCDTRGRFGMAWTSDLDQARTFAYDGLRGRAPGHVFTATVQPEHLLTYIGEEIGRREDEYVVDPDGLSDDNVTLVEKGRSQ
jgi:hypothetical protein